MIPQVVVDLIRPLPCRDAVFEPAQPPRRLGFQIEPVRLKCRIVEAEPSGGVEDVLPLLVAERLLYRREHARRGYRR